VSSTKSITIRTPQLCDAAEVLTLIHESHSFLTPWVVAPTTDIEFMLYCQRIKSDNSYVGYLVCDQNQIAGIINVNDIVRGSFQSASIGFYLFSGYTGKGVMSAGLQLVLQEVFATHQLHRIEANIQPKNLSSIHCVQRNGFVKEGFSEHFLKVNDDWRDHERWAITREIWEKG